ncbi:MAG TPA: MDR family oxidoreductase [Rhizomicrobium sp.]|nr:MDR family oxidoreductase [Rhizomicrobium sp.]
MKNRFKAILIRKENGGQSVDLTDLGPGDLMQGDVTVAISHSTVNYKDGLALTGRAPVIRRFPMVPGIDFAGVVEESSNSRFKPGDGVLLNGYGVGEAHFGGYSQYARVNGDWLVPLPSRFTAAEAMAIGTAGFTAMLAVLQLEFAGVSPDKGPVLVTGAAGGVGSLAILILSKLGYRILASTGRPEEETYLRKLGAAEVLPRSELTGEPKPLSKERWNGAIDSVGSRTLVNVLSSTSYGGAVAACGLAGGMDLPASVAPFILRGVSLLGVDSVQAPMQRRLRAWERLAHDVDRAKLAALSRRISLHDVQSAAEDILAGKVRGRLVVDLR